MTNAAELEGMAHDEVVELLPQTALMAQTDRFSEAWSQICPCPSDDVLDDIARDDPTYQVISDTLIPHSRIPGLSLLRYQTMHGAIAYQPCSKDIDLMGLFDAIAPLENRDQLFKNAREWSCVIQAMEMLPRDIRWVLAVIYNFANEMLRPENNEACLWHARSWLFYWYEIADGLFVKYRIMASTPDEDWFLRPLQVQENSSSTQVAIVSQLQRIPSVSKSPKRLKGPQVSSSDGDLDMDTNSRVEAWVQSQAQLVPAQASIPVTPRQRQPEWYTNRNRSRLNPAAAVFTPAPFSSSGDTSMGSNEHLGIRSLIRPTSFEAQIS